jgi:hypothetical protein
MKQKNLSIVAFVAWLWLAAAAHSSTTTRVHANDDAFPLRGGGGGEGPPKQKWHSRKLRRRQRRLDDDGNSNSNPVRIDGQYLVFLKQPAVGGGGHDPPPPARSLAMLHHRRLPTTTTSNNNDDHHHDENGPLRTVTLQGLNQQELLSLIDDEDVAFVEQVSFYYRYIASFIHGNNNTNPHTKNQQPSSLNVFRINTFLSLHGIWNHHHRHHQVLYPGDWIDWINNNRNWTICFIRATRVRAWTCLCSIRGYCEPIPSFAVAKPFVVSTRCRTI